MTDRAESLPELNVSREIGISRSRVSRETASDGLRDLNEILRANVPGVLAYFRRRVDSPEDAADLLSETLLVVWRKEKRVPSAEHEARMYIFGIARKVLSTHRRSFRRRSALVQRLTSDLVMTLEAPQPDSTEGHTVRDAIAKLNPQDQEIIRLVFWDGFSQADAAGLLGMNESTVRTRLARAKAKLQALLDIPE